MRITTPRSTMFCTARCGWERTEDDDAWSREGSYLRGVYESRECPRCKRPLAWDPNGGAPPPIPTALTWLRRGLTEVVGESRARLAPALMLWLHSNQVAVVPFALRDDCRLWGYHGVIRNRARRKELGRVQFDLFKLEEGQQLSFALGVLVYIGTENRLEAEAAQRAEAAYMAERGRKSA